MWNLRRLGYYSLKALSATPSLMSAPRLGLVSTQARFFARQNPSASGSEEQEVIDISAESSPSQDTLNISNTECHSFKAETQQLLDIVAKSIYKDSDVFIRELTSNASDALEKQRLQALTGQAQESHQLEIQIYTDWVRNQIVFQDNGIGMTKNELIENLGTIAKSGSKSFLESVAAGGENIIGQFGVGFYSAFIVSNRVDVLTKSDQDDSYWIWTSEAQDEFSISQVELHEDEQFNRGTKIILHLKEAHSDFSKKANVEKTLTKYSSFINFPISLDGKLVNLTEAIWAKSASDVQESDYKQLFKHLTSPSEDYFAYMHYSVDVPLLIKAVLFIPNTHGEKAGLAFERPGLNLHTRKVLIVEKCSELVPNWLRFMKGVVDCEDLPLNISRENYQNTELIFRLQKVVTKRIIKFLQDEAKANPDKYVNWFRDFQHFIKEGAGTDLENQQEIVKLLRFEWNKDTSAVSLDQYVDQMAEDEEEILFLYAHNRETAINSPFLESAPDQKIIFCYSPIDEMLFGQINRYRGKTFKSVEKLKSDESKIEHQLEDVDSFKSWIQSELSGKIKDVTLSDRLIDSPAVLTNELTQGMRYVMQMVEQQTQQKQQMSNTQVLEVNPKHPLIVKLNQIRMKERRLASDIIKQIYDNAQVHSGELQDLNQMLTRVNHFMMQLMEKSAQ